MTMMVTMMMMMVTMMTMIVKMTMMMVTMIMMMVTEWCAKAYLLMCSHPLCRGNEVGGIHLSDRFISHHHHESLYISSSSWRWCLFLFQNQTENMLSFISKSWWICLDKHINSVICRLTGCSASNPNFNNLFWVMTRTTMMTVVQWLWWWSMMTIVNLLH